MTDVSEYRRQEDALDVNVPRQPVVQGEGMEQELLTINFGPHHPATHGVLRLLVHLEGEVVRDLKPIIGYVHTGIEKTAEDKSYWKVVPIVERMDYLAYYFNAMAYCGAVETLVGVEVPKRAQYLRVLHLELNRIMSHLVWLGTSALDLGAISMFWYCFRERDRILDLFELVAGFRPEHLELGDLAQSAGIRAKADVVEYLGNEELLHVTVQGHEGDVVAVVGSEHMTRPGDVIELKLPLDRLQLFDAETGDALAAKVAAAAA